MTAGWALAAVILLGLGWVAVAAADRAARRRPLPRVTQHPRGPRMPSWAYERPGPPPARVLPVRPAVRHRRPLR
ncbi:hypothetical protein [Streptomyces uncialis]|uniref:hypothetical protein n=1 Tax=Streptomyces uncialis TaxID=1048205 RepID=UPI00225149A3|nr:hypothetical protein [Streptomyces uncialis]MCX4661476.1 hypothetical protein [Streptomyces uncialis]